MKDKKSVDRKREAVRRVINDMLNGATNSVLTDKLMNDDYNLGFNYTKNGAQHITKEARRILRKDFEEERAELRERLFNMFLDVYTEAKEIGQHQSALKALEDICKLTGVNEPDKQEVTLNDIIIDFKFDED